MADECWMEEAETTNRKLLKRSKSTLLKYVHLWRVEFRCYPPSEPPPPPAFPLASPLLLTLPPFSYSAADVLFTAVSKYTFYYSELPSSGASSRLCACFLCFRGLQVRSDRCRWRLRARP